MHKIRTFLTFAERGEEAVKFYVSIFKDSRFLSLVRYEGQGLMGTGALLNATFELDGQGFMAMDGGPDFSFARGTSPFVGCETQDEIDEVWAPFRKGGRAALRLAEGSV